MSITELKTSSPPETPNLRPHKLHLHFSSDQDSSSDDHSSDYSSISTSPSSPSSHSHQPGPPQFGPNHALIGSLTREEGHIYSIAAAGDLLLTGSESKSVSAWKNLTDISGFKSGSGMVKAIVVFGEKIFTGHHDGKIRVWTYDESLINCSRIGNLPKSQDLLVNSMNPRNYLRVRSKRRVPWPKHCDTVSCMSVDAGRGLLYSGSWDKTLKVWRISDSKCLESIAAHDDAVNSVATAAEGLVFTGSADGTVKAWRREFVGNGTKHLLVETMEEVGAVTAVVASHGGGIGAECKLKVLTPAQRAATVVYAGYSDGLIRFWEVEKQSMAYGAILRGHKMAVLCLVVGGNLVMSGSTDKSICVWRRDGGGKHACTAVLTGHQGPVKCLAVENDTSTAANEEEGRRRWTLYSGSLDKCVKIWSVFEPNQD